ncbi:cytochrome c class I [Gluconacetobacter azotocaptans DSM 13594]|nr:cytochrome c class I [Gluconacetobacter azotocaptans DSM 13594]
MTARSRAVKRVLAPRALAGMLASMLCVAACPVARAADNSAVERRAVTFNHAQTNYMLHCGGCHGTLGLSPPHSVPLLRGQAGWLVCDAQGRAYVDGLPNVTRASLSDADLADVLNFVIFTLGATPGSVHAAPFTAREVGVMRAAPESTVPLHLRRQQAVERIIKVCGAPQSLLDYKPM